MELTPEQLKYLNSLPPENTEAIKNSIILANIIKKDISDKEIQKKFFNSSEPEKKEIIQKIIDKNLELKKTLNIPDNLVSDDNLKETIIVDFAQNADIYSSESNNQPDYTLRNKIVGTLNKGGEYIEEKVKENPYAFLGISAADMVIAGATLRTAVGPYAWLLPMLGSVGAEALDYTGITSGVTGKFKWEPVTDAFVNPVVRPISALGDYGDISAADIPKDISMALAPVRDKIIQQGKAII